MSNPGVTFDGFVTSGESVPGVMNASLAGRPFRLNPDSIQLGFTVKTSRTETVGGIVIQVFGIDFSDLIISGSFGVGGWQQQLAFLEIQRTQGLRQAQRDGFGHLDLTMPPAEPIRFLFPSRGYDFQVYLKDYQSPDGETVVYDNTIINPKWTLTLFIENDNSGLQFAAADAYIDRLSKGLGWKLSNFNGPIDSADVQAFLNQQETIAGVTTAQDYINEAFGGPMTPPTQAGVPQPTGGAPGSTPLTGSGNVQQAFNYFVAKGLSKTQSAGIVGNFMTESSCDPTVNQQGGGPGRGIAQWTVSDRWQGVLALAKKEGKSERDLGVQLDFVWQELNSSEAGALSALRGTTTAAQAAQVFCNLYERAGIPNSGSRISNANSVLAQFG